MDELEKVLNRSYRGQGIMRAKAIRPKPVRKGRNKMREARLLRGGQEGSSVLESHWAPGPAPGRAGVCSALPQSPAQAQA
jgi:hypothetical protein